VAEHHCVAIPTGVSLTDAAAGLTPYATAWEALVETARVRPGERVLITGAGGGVGAHAVQVARLCGAQVIAAVGGKEKAERVRALGASAVVDYKAEGLVEGVRRVTGGEGVDVVLDGIGGEVLQGCLEVVGEGGRIAVIGAHAGEKVETDMIKLFRRHISLLGCGRSTLWIYETVLGLMARGELKPVVHAVFPLEKAAEAHELMESRNFFGRIVLRPGDDEILV
jgi:NADPH:quinone reductase-like Zn-dependent oxidoreductase